ncbi:DNA-binding NarL/FixJ family response regulator [Methanomicrobium sp. W14]|uniref:response regulator n=1 Tax=Methanomicrobium sp. W14 TaxID=2817839 RepID=UPI001AE6F650|nr:response regulator [Methanomicrobium sp. W14]MBP2132251.1 DNA-binding NarL/FixJ family response regulator [Methanomicrobium sp. W14]
MKNSSILIVEDEMIIAMEIQATLKKLGYSVIGTVIGGDEAVKTAGEKSPDLVLMDIRLKGNIDGIQAAEKIMGMYGIPVIFLTGNSDQKTIERAVAIKPAGFLIKPFKERELLGNIEMALHKKEGIKTPDSQEKTENYDPSSDLTAQRLSSFNSPLITTDCSGVITHANETALNMLSPGDGKLTGKKLSDVFETINEDDKISANPKYFWPDTIAYKADSKNKIRVNLYSGFSEDSQKNIRDFIFSVGAASDESENQKNPVDEIRSIMNSFSEVIFVADSKLEILYYNDNFTELVKRLGISPFLLKRPIPDIQELSAFVAEDEYDEVFRTNHSITKTKRLKSKNKVNNFFSISIVPNSGENGTEYVTTIIEDITSIVNTKDYSRYLAQNLGEIKKSLLSVNSMITNVKKPLSEIIKAVSGKNSTEFALIFEKTAEIEDIIENFNLNRIKYESAIDHIDFLDKSMENW